MKKVKAMKRRGVESLFQKIGVSDGTVDLEYEVRRRLMNGGGVDD